jgi:hypothetical protein
MKTIAYAELWNPKMAKNGFSTIFPPIKIGTTWAENKPENN